MAWNCTRLPTPEKPFSLCAGISGNGGQVLSEQDFSHSFEMTIRAELLLIS